MDFVYNNGGRKQQHVQGMIKGTRSDCVVRAISIATERDYSEIWLDVFNYVFSHSNFTRHPDNGIATHLVDNYLFRLGYGYMERCDRTILLKDIYNQVSGLSKHTIIRTHKHLTVASIDCVYDRWDCRNEEIKGYFYKIP